MRFCSLVFFLSVMSCSAWADCYGLWSLPLSLSGTQNQLLFSGRVGGSGNGQGYSTCPNRGAYTYDFRYNIVSNTATCQNSITGKNYNAPVVVTGGSISSGALSKLTTKQYGGETFDIWGRFFVSPSNIPPMTSGTTGGMYNMDITMDVSSLPSGSYSCSIKNAHAGYATNTNSVSTGIDTVFNAVVARNFWAYGSVPITIQAACQIPDSLDINHGRLASGSDDVKVGYIRVICNATSSLKVSLVSLTGSSTVTDGVMVDMAGGSQSKLSVIGEEGNIRKESSFNLQPNIAMNIGFQSWLQAKGDGYQEGSAVAKFIYN